MEADLFYKGVRPALNVGLSVSRVGGSAQIKPMKKVAGKLKLDLAQFRELEAFSQFASDLDPETKKQIDRGRRVTEMLKQKQYTPLAVELQVVSIFAVNTGYFDDIETSEIGVSEEKLHSFLKKVKSDLLTKIAGGEWSDEVEKELKESLEESKKQV